MERARLAAVVLVLVGASLAGSAWYTADDVGHAGQPPPERVVSPAEDAGAFWPYTSRRRSVDGRTLALNVVVRGEATRVRRVLTDRTAANWTHEEPETPMADSPWRPTHGSSRYTYVRRGETEGRWKDADYQLGVGEYLGRQIHVRAYVVPGGRTTVLQAHTEYWDWFRLRHTVTGIDDATTFLERDLRSAGGELDVRREYHGLRGGRSNGWISVVDVRPAREGRAAFARDGAVRRPAQNGLTVGGDAGGRPAVAPEFEASPPNRGSPPLSLLLVLGGAPLAALAARWARPGDGEAWRDVLLVVSLVAVVLSVRTGGVVLENLFPAVNPKYVSLVAYPVLALGPLAVVRAFAPSRPPERAAVLAAVGFGAGVVLDFGTVSVVAVPIDVALHRLALVGALGLVAAGTAGRSRRLTAAGLAAWAVGLVMPLAGLI